MVKTRPDVSIVMPSFEQAAFVSAAVDSVLDQEGVDVELVVFDPGSRDGSRAILEDLAARRGERMRLFFEPDRGQSDAVNKGMERARGRILGWLNSDDLLLPGALRRVAAVLGGAGGPAWCYGRARMVDEAGRPTGRLIESYKAWRSRRFSRLRLLTENFIPQMAVFWTRELWAAAGGLRVEKDLDMDYDLWLRFARVAEPIVLREDLAAFRVHGEAKGSTRTGEQLDAAWRTAREHAGELGLAGRAALVVHRLLGWRTRLVYRFYKPRPRRGA